MLRITLVPAVALGLIVVAPWLVQVTTGLQISLLAGESLFILVNTVKDAFRQLEAQAMMRNYEGFIR